MNTEGAALRRGAPSPATVRERATPERPVTTVSHSSHFHFFTLSQTCYYSLYTSPCILGLLSCVIWFTTYIFTCRAHSFFAGCTSGAKQKLVLLQPDMPSQLLLLFLLLNFRKSVVAVALNSIRLADFRLTLHVVFSLRVSFFDILQHCIDIFCGVWCWKLCVKFPSPQNPDFLFICRQTQLSLHVRGNRTGKHICWIKNRPLFL